MDIILKKKEEVDDTSPNFQGSLKEVFTKFEVGRYPGIALVRNSNVTVQHAIQKL